jgi:hypothetical protein
LLRVYKDTIVKKVERESNGVAHVLAQLEKLGVSVILPDAVDADHHKQL